jgi:hypothetical protein
VSPYLSTSALSLSKPKPPTSDNDLLEQHQPKGFMAGNERLDPVIEVDVASQRSSISSTSNETVPASPLLKTPNIEPGYSHSTPN